MTAAEYALILDPERKVEGWWLVGTKYEGTMDWTYIGPPDLHTARSEAWRGEEWLEARGYCWFREEFPYSKTWKTQVYKRVPRTDEFGPSHLLIGGTYTDHAAAIAEAVRRVNDGQK